MFRSQATSCAAFVHHPVYGKGPGALVINLKHFPKRGQYSSRPADHFRYCIIPPLGNVRNRVGFEPTIRVPSPFRHIGLSDLRSQRNQARFAGEVGP